MRRKKSFLTSLMPSGIVIPVPNGALRKFTALLLTSLFRPSYHLFSSPFSCRPETVRCDRCKSFFHMGCVQPPLIAKPTRGYGWTCGPCSRAHEQAVEGHDVRHAPSPLTKPKSHAPPARGRGRPRKDRTLAEKEENVPVRHFKMWPFRYFGFVFFLINDSERCREL